MAKLRRGRRPSRTKVSKDYQVFVSHATADKWIARVICEKIEQTGASTFRDDRDIKGGDDIPEQIRRQIIRSKELLLLLTPKSVGRPWILIEAVLAWDRSKRIRIIVVLYHVEFDSIPEIIKTRKAIPLNDFDNYLAELADRLRELKK